MSRPNVLDGDTCSPPTEESASQADDGRGRMMFRDEGSALLPQLVGLRRALHRIPETGLDLPLTQRRVLEALAPLDLEVTTGRRTTSVCAVLRGGRPGPAVLLRGDMDALPVQEETGLEFAATNGRMHACGHDLHTAGLVGAAMILSAHRDELAGDVLFMFQPGEEGYGGAKVMLEEGLLDIAGQRPVAAYAVHVYPGEPGRFRTRPGAVLAGSNELRITVMGRGGHGSAPESACDPVPALIEIAAGLQTMITRQFSVFDPVVLTVTQLQAGQAINVIPESASLGATVRTLSTAATAAVERAATRLAEGISAAHGCTAEVDFRVAYPVTVNDRAETERALQTLRSEFGAERIEVQPYPAMASEDFAFVLEEIPGCFLSLSCSPEGVDLAAAAHNHSPRVLFDDAVLGDQAAALASLAWARLRTVQVESDS